MPPAIGSLDLVALAVFAACAILYPLVVDRIPAVRAKSVMAAMDIHRRRWMRAMAHREARIVDAAIVGNLMQSTSFLATTAIFILGGLVALLGASDMGLRVVGMLPFAEPADPALWELKIALLILIFVNAFFALTWSLRQFNYASILIGGIGATPDARNLRNADVAATVANRAAIHFNSGLRAYYFGLAALAWLVHPVALMLACLWVLRELYRREFKSVVRDAVMEDA
jgi:uncharacterized membrane protein